jgi:SAM-dependent methyltransferase
VLQLAAHAAISDPPRPLRLVELGAGTGWAGLRLAAALTRRGRDVDLLSTDIAPDFLPQPGRRGRVMVRSARLDALTDPIPEADITIANLLIHHLERAHAVGLLERMRAASRRGGAVFDLDRNRWAFACFRVFFPLWARSPFTCADALISVQQAFRVGELADMAREAGIERPHLRRYVGLRTLLWWEA